MDLLKPEYNSLKKQVLHLVLNYLSQLKTILRAKAIGRLQSVACFRVQTLEKLRLHNHNASAQKYPCVLLH